MEAPAGSAATGTAAAAARSRPGSGVDEDPRLLCAAAAALSRAVAVLADKTLMLSYSYGLGTDSATDAHHALALRLSDDGSVSWPAAGRASDVDTVKASAEVVLAAAGATMLPAAAHSGTTPRVETRRQRAPRTCLECPRGGCALPLPHYPWRPLEGALMVGGGP